MPIVGVLKGQIVKLASKYYFTIFFFKLTLLKSLEYKFWSYTDQYTREAMHYDSLSWFSPLLLYSMNQARVSKCLK